MAATSRRSSACRVIVGGRYGLSSKEFTPADGQAASSTSWPPRGPTPQFTVGIVDDVTHLSLAGRPTRSDAAARRRGPAVFFGLGSRRHRRRQQGVGQDHRRAHRRCYAQGYFVYDSKKSGSVTVSHLRFGPEPIRSTYLIERGRLRRLPPVRPAREGDVLERGQAAARRSCSTARIGPDEVWDAPARARSSAQIIDKQHRRCGSSTPTAVAKRRRHGQPHQHGHAAVLLRARRRAAAPTRRSPRIKDVDRRRPTRKRGDEVVERNFAAIDAVARRRCGTSPLAEAPRDAAPAARCSMPGGAPDFVSGVTAQLIAGNGDLLPGERAAGRRHVPDRRRRGTRSASWRRRSRSGIRRSASTAASARSSARTPRSG